MEALQDILHRLGITSGSASEIRSKSGVSVYRVADGSSSYVLKTYENQADRREIANYRLLQSLGIPTLSVIASTDDALLMEDVRLSKTLRLAVKEDMDDPAVATALAAWYRLLHERGKAYVAANGSGMYDELDAITPENMDRVAIKTDTAKNPVWTLLRENFGAVAAMVAAIPRTLTYNDFYYTNMIVAKDASSAFMFDYNLLGKGYVYADLRNVTSSLGDAAGNAFLTAYGAYDPGEKLFDSVASVLTTLHFACERERFPDWAAEELDKVKDGTLEAALRQLLQS